MLHILYCGIPAYNNNRLYTTEFRVSGSVCASSYRRLQTVWRLWRRGRERERERESQTHGACRVQMVSVQEWKGERNGPTITTYCTPRDERAREMHRETEFTASRLHDYLYILGIYYIYIYIIFCTYTLYAYYIICKYT